MTRDLGFRSDPSSKLTVVTREWTGAFEEQREKLRALPRMNKRTKGSKVTSARDEKLMKRSW